MSDPRLNIPTKNTNALGWMSWHKSLLSAMSKDQANQIWQSYYKQYANTLTDDKALREYMKSQGVDISGVLDKAQDATTNFFGGIGSFFKVGGIVTMVVVGVALFAILKAALNIAKNPNATLNSVAQLKK